VKNIRFILTLLFFLSPVACVLFQPIPTNDLFVGEGAPILLTIKPSDAPAPNTNQPASDTGVTPSPFMLVAYYPYWNNTTYHVSKIPAGELSVVNYAFALPTETSECTPGDPEAGETQFPALLELKEKYPHLKTMLSVGGEGTAQAFSAATASEAQLDHFVSACVQLMKNNGFDGLDIDWEYPTAEQMTTYTSLLEKLRRGLDSQSHTDSRRYLLTIAAPAGSYSMAGMDIPKLTPLLDWINLMTYDFYGSWSETTGFNSPLYTSPTDPAQWSIDSTIQMYLYLGVPPKKLVLGVPFYGRGWQGVKDVNQGLFQPFNKQPEANSGDSFTYIQLEQVYIDKLPRFWDDIAKAPWLFDASKGLMISYDDPQSLGYKAQYARQQNLGGMMIWEITSDDEDGSLLAAIQAALQE